MKSWTYATGVSLLLILAHSARATTGGPEVVRPLGWDRSAGEVYFAVDHWGESGLAPTVMKLRLDAPDTARCQPLWWSKGVYEDSVYRGRMRRLKKRLTRLEETSWTTIPGGMQIVSADTFRTEWEGPYARYHVRGQFGGRQGTIEAITYVDHAVRMIRYYEINGRAIGVFSFIGIPYEGGYELQIPAFVPAQRGSRVLLQWGRGYE